MSGITDSAKFNKNSSYYVEVDPAGGGGQVIQGNLQVSGNITAGGDSSTVGSVSGGSLNINGASNLGVNGVSLSTVGAGGLAVLGQIASTGLIGGQNGLAITGNTVLTGALTTTALTTAGGGLSVNGVSALGGATTSAGLLTAGAGLAVTGNSTVSGSATANKVTSLTAVSGQNAIRAITTNVSDNITDPITIPWTGVTQQLMGVIQGAGNNFSVNYTMPPDIYTNPAYNGMTIAEGQLVFTGARVVGIGIIGPASNVIVSGFLSTANIGTPYTYFKVTKTVSSNAFPDGIYLQLGSNVNTQVG
jgi:hypothetical protein